MRHVRPGAPCSFCGAPVELPPAPGAGGPALPPERLFNDPSAPPLYGAPRRLNTGPGLGTPALMLVLLLLAIAAMAYVRYIRL